jgi:lysine-specific demethylase PHF8
MKVTAPKIVCDISWASNNVWPLPVESNDSSEKVKISNYWVKPEVQKYCLISAGNSYTDFHVDFGGSSVWYHIVKGEKVFYLIEPTEENLKIYEKWLCVKNHSEVFLGDKVKKCYIFKITEGNTIFLPTGWIHAVYTPNDSLVFGGNFLHSYGIPLQLRIYDMEVRLKTPEKFRFPAFETFQWYAGKYHEQQLKKSNANRECLSLKMFNDIKYLRDQLKKWINSKNFYELHDYQIPRSIDHDKLMNMMNRELSKAEVLIKSNTSHNNNYSKNSLKIKLKLNPNDLASSTSTLICDKNQSGDENNTKKSSQKNKEILTFAATENIAEIKLDKNMVNHLIIL